MAVVEGTGISGQQLTYSDREIADLAEQEARSMLGMDWADALKQLESGALAGTAAEAQLRMLQFLTGPVGPTAGDLRSRCRLPAARRKTASTSSPSTFASSWRRRLRVNR